MHGARHVTVACWHVPSMHAHMLGAWAKRPEHRRCVEPRGWSDDGNSNGKLQIVLRGVRTWCWYLESELGKPPIWASKDAAAGSA